MNHQSIECEWLTLKTTESASFIFYVSVFLFQFFLCFFANFCQNASMFAHNITSSIVLQSSKLKEHLNKISLIELKTGRQQGKGGGDISLGPYYFQVVQRYLLGTLLGQLLQKDHLFTLMPANLGKEPLVSRRKLLTTKQLNFPTFACISLLRSLGIK